MIAGCRIKAVFGLLVAVLLSTPATYADRDSESKLASGRVISGHKKAGDVEFVTATIRVNQPPDRVWPILANPFEFQEKISPHFKTLSVLEDHADMSLLKCRVELGFFLPNIKYIVESRYEQGRRISFRSREGDLKDLRGMWEITPIDGGKACDVSYAMYVNPGFPVPQWFIRQGIKNDIPKTLIGLRDRVESIYTHHNPPVRRSLVAAGNTMSRI